MRKTLTSIPAWFEHLPGISLDFGPAVCMKTGILAGCKPDRHGQKLIRRPFFAQQTGAEELRGRPGFSHRPNQEIVRYTWRERRWKQSCFWAGWSETSHSHTSVRTALTFPAIPKLRRRVFGVSIATWLAPCRREQPRLDLTSEEKKAAEKFLAPYRLAGNSHIRDVIRVDPMGLVVHQLYMTLAKAREFMDHATARSWCIRQCLAVRPKENKILQGNFRRNSAEIEIPHREFAVNFQPGNTFGIEELAAHVSATEFAGRTLLWAGYHRAYARIASFEADAIERSLLVVLSHDGDYLVDPDSPEPELRATLLGLRPPLFADFFDERLFLKVNLRKKRYELRLRASVEAVSDDT